MRNELLVINPQAFNKIAIAGDLHGDLHALIALLKFVDLDNDLLIFLGDYADRGDFGVETIRKVAALRDNHPEHMFVLMGNHEDYTEEGEPKFSPCTLIEETEGKVGSWNKFFEDEFKPFIDSLHLSALIPDNALLVHGGVSRKVSGIEDLRFPSVEIRQDILWSDPFDGTGEYPSSRGSGVEFGADISASVCKALGVNRIIRSHQPTIAMTGPNSAQNGKVITVQCTSVYGGEPFVYFVSPTSVKHDSYRKVLE